MGLMYLIKHFPQTLHVCDRYRIDLQFLYDIPVHHRDFITTVLILPDKPIHTAIHAGSLYFRFCEGVLQFVGCIVETIGNVQKLPVIYISGKRCILRKVACHVKFICGHGQIDRLVKISDLNVD